MRRIKIKIIPNASKNEIIKSKEDFLKIKLCAVPEKGKANKALIKFLSKHFKTAKSNITIIKGLRSKHKTVQIQ